MSFLLDTNVVSEMRKIQGGRADLGVAAWAGATRLTDMHVSVITLQELEVGVLRMERRDVATGVVLRRWLDEKIGALFQGRIMPIDAEVAKRAAHLHVPDRRPLLDALIAATALINGLTVVTRNVVDFSPMGARLVNPWRN